MSLRRLLVSTATIWRPTQTADAFGDKPFTYTAGATVKCRVVPPKGTLEDLGPGEQPTGNVIGYFLPGAGVQIRDVIQITDGPEAGRRYRIMDVADQAKMTPTVHHVETVMEPFAGTLP
jgi:hypothetical protein